ncbi:MAG: GNAT family N-acetyltransferase [Kofleriaceae bacterium]
MIDPALIHHALPDRILTERLELRRDSVADARAVLAAVLASRAELAKWLDWVVPDYDLREAVRNQRRAVEDWRAGYAFQWRIWERRPGAATAALGPPQALLGSIDVHSIDWRARRAELGYWLASSAVGRGYLTEAGRAVTDVGFARLGFAVLTIRCHPDNVRSIATARRLGYHELAFDADGVVRLSRRADPGEVTP